MYYNILFLILVLFISSLAPQDAQWPWMIPEPIDAFYISLAMYGTILALIILQNRMFSLRVRRNKGFMVVLTNIELLLFLLLFHFLLGGTRVLSHYSFQSLSLLLSLVFYFFGLTVFYASYYISRPHFSFEHIKRELLFIIPFSIPLLLMTLFLDLTDYLAWSDSMLFISFGLFLLFVLMVYPFFIQKFWLCKNLSDTRLKEKLNEICTKAKFRHAGFKTWTVMNHSLTAAILGTVPAFRYIMFSQRLLHEMPPDCIQAILAHEIGHSAHKHLWKYPFIILGVSLLLSIISLFYTSNENNEPLSIFIYSISLLTIYISVIVVYFRVVFGFFSRLFERQADLYVFSLKMNPESLIKALDLIGTLTGGTHDQPNWHHHSIRERINFLEEAICDPSLVQQHHRKVNFYFYGYFFFLAIMLFVIYTGFL